MSLVADMPGHRDADASKNKIPFKYFVFYRKFNILQYYFRITFRSGFYKWSNQKRFSLIDTETKH